MPLVYNFVTGIHFHEANHNLQECCMTPGPNDSMKSVLEQLVSHGDQVDWPGAYDPERFFYIHSPGRLDSAMLLAARLQPCGIDDIRD